MAISGLNINFIFWLLFFRKCVIMLFVLYVCKFPGVAQLVGRLVWELEHQIGSTSRNVAYSPLSSQIPLITSIESWAKLWYNFFDHIFDHNEHFFLIKYPGVAQLVGRLVWDQDAASSSLATRTKSPESAYAESGLFYLYGVRIEQSNATRTSVAGEGLTEPNLYLRHLARMQTSLAPPVEAASFQHKNCRSFSNSHPIAAYCTKMTDGSNLQHFLFWI